MTWAETKAACLRSMARRYREYGFTSDTIRRMLVQAEQWFDEYPFGAPATLTHAQPDAEDCE